MASQSSRLGLIVPTTADQFSTQDIAGNWSTIDRYPGTYICTSASRPNSGVGSAPTWTTAHNGMRILETDTQLEWKWTGSAFVRVAPVGHIANATNAGTVTSSSSSAYITAVSVSNISIPPGNRWIQVLTTWQLIQNTNGITVLAFIVDGTPKTYSISGDSTAASQGAQGSSGGLSIFTQLSAGLHTFAIGIRTVALAPPAGQGTSTASGVTIDVLET